MGAVLARLIVFSRWAMVPLLLGLVLALLLLVLAFAIDLVRFAVHMPWATPTEVLVGLLALIDLTLVGGLLVIIIYSGYENFVEKIDQTNAAWPTWMTKVSFSGLKQKLFASMMAIAGITLLKALMKLEESVSEVQVRWLVIANVIFVVAYAVLAVTDHVTGAGKGKDGD